MHIHEHQASMFGSAMTRVMPAVHLYKVINTAQGIMTTAAQHTCVVQTQPS